MTKEVVSDTVKATKEEKNILNILENILRTVYLI